MVLPVKANGKNQKDPMVSLISLICRATVFPTDFENKIIYKKALYTTAKRAS